MKTALLLASLLSALLFALLYTLPEVDPQSAPKAFARGMSLLPLVLSLLLCSAIAAVLGCLQIRRHGVQQTFRHPTTWVSVLLLLPAAYTLGFMLLSIITHL